MATPPLALHTWSLDSTPLDAVLKIARQTGWQAVELRHIDFVRAAEAGQSEDDVIALVRASGLPVAAVGARLGWMYAEGEERQQLFDIFEATCRRAAALNCRVVQSPVDVPAGDLQAAAARVRQIGEIARRYGVRVALEPICIAQQFSTLASGKALLAAAGHPSVGLDVDCYHIERSGDGIPEVETLTLDEIVYVQYSDVPADAGPPTPDSLLNRLQPGQGVVPMAEFQRILTAKGYTGPYSFEAPNPAAWDRDPQTVSDEAYAASLAAFH
ncbi:MAG: sugar phosphate isomerase/epimerase [Chloroflexi bacterium]|nr:sugar phosphate isomerase/epimerase [Chloroflexota bacterium]